MSRILVWESLEAHLKMVNDPISAQLGAELSKCMGGPDASMFHVYYDPAAATASLLNAPVTCFVQSPKLAEGKTEADFKATIDIVRGATDIKGLQGMAWGRKVENDSEYTMITSWDTIEVRLPVLSA